MFEDDALQPTPSAMCDVGQCAVADLIDLVENGHAVEARGERAGDTIKI
jgi:hypothetical protein